MSMDIQYESTNATLEFSPYTCNYMDCCASISDITLAVYDAITLGVMSTSIVAAPVYDSGSGTYSITVDTSVIRDPF